MRLPAASHPPPNTSPPPPPFFPVWMVGSLGSQECVQIMEGSEKIMSQGSNPSSELAVSRCSSPLPSPGLQFYSRTAFPKSDPFTLLNAKLERMLDYKGLFQSYHSSKTRPCSHSREIGQGIWRRGRRERGRRDGWRAGRALCFSQ